MKHHPGRSFVLLTAALLFLAALSCSGNTIYVKYDSPGSQDGTSWGTAYHSVQQGLDAATLEAEVWVARGTYVERITLEDGVGLYGGFAGTETLRTQRDPEANETTLDSNNNPAGGVVTVPPGATTTCVIDGFTICGGVGMFVDGSRLGAGILCIGASPTISNNIIRTNGGGDGFFTSHGGGIYCAGGAAPQISNNVITENEVSGYALQGYGRGGGIYCVSSSPTISGNTFDGNKAGYSGAAIYCSGSAPTISNNVITNNTCYPGIGMGGGLYCSVSSSPLISGNVISYNEPGGIGCLDSSPTIAANQILCNDGNGIYANNSSPVITDNLIGSNTEIFGGGVATLGGSPRIEGNLITGNVVVETCSESGCQGGYGGGVYCSGGTPLVLRNTVKGNFAQRGGAGIWCSAGTIANNAVVGNEGAGIQYAGVPVITNNTAAWNTAAGIYAGSGVSAVNISNNISAFNQYGISDPRNLAVLRNNCVFGNASNYYGVSPGTGDIQLDPKLVSSVYGNAHIQGNSPCRNAGDDSAVQIDWLDIDGQARIQETHVDIGADESSGTNWSAAPKIVRVAPTGDDANDGSTWLLAKRSVQSGINAAVTHGGEVWVAAGTYREQLTALPYVGLYGGFSGDETSRDQRDWSLQTTILDGLGKGSTVRILAGRSTATVDGFMITNSYVNETYPLYGGGIYCYFASPTIKHNTIIGNTANWSGGGITCYSASPLIAQNMILSNCSHEYGGGIDCYINSRPTIANNVIAGNGAASGGGISVRENSLAWIINNTLIFNTAGERVASGEESFHNYGGGIYISKSSPVIANTIVAFGSSGIYQKEAGYLVSLVNNCVYGNNSADYQQINPGNWDISVDPMMSSMAGPHGHIQRGSPCVDAGDDDVWALEEIADIDDQGRIQGEHVDIGADESDDTTWSISPTVVRVKPDGDDSNDGSTWALAKQSIKAATDVVATRGGEVWVKAGTFAPTSLYAFVSLYGGFAGTEDQRDHRDWTASVSVIDGQGARIAVRMQAGYTSTTVDGMTIQNAGKGIGCRFGAFPTITNSRFTGANEVGVDLYSASPRILSNTFSNLFSGVSTQYGRPVIDGNAMSSCSHSGVYLVNDLGATITNNLLTTNARAIYCRYSSPLISGNTIADNSGVSGVAIYCYLYCSPTVTNNTVVGNTSSDVATGVVFCDEGTSPTFSNNIIAFNSSGICATDATPLLRNNCVYSDGGYEYVGVSPGVGDISSDPLLVDRIQGDYHLAVGSPCINAGWNSAPNLPVVDMDLDARIYDTTVDIGVDEWYPAGVAIGEAKSRAEGITEKIDGGIVTFVSGDDFYIEKADRSSGILVTKTSHGLAVGGKANVMGPLDTNDSGEKFVDATYVMRTGTGSIEPLILPNRSIGGGDYFFNGITGAGQQGIAGAADVNNIGLLIATTGEVTERGSDWFYIDDGSGLLDDSGFTGVKVEAPGMTIPALDAYVKVTGISSCFKSGSDLYRLIRAREIE